MPILLEFLCVPMVMTLCASEQKRDKVVHLPYKATVLSGR